MGFLVSTETVPIGYGADYFKVTANGSTVLLNDTFSNGPGDNGIGSHEPFQSYGGPGLSGVYFAMTGSSSTSQTAFGYCVDISNGCSLLGPNETTYEFAFTLNDNASSILFSFIGNATNIFPTKRLASTT